MSDHELVVTRPYDHEHLKTIPLTDEATALSYLDKAVALFKDRDGWLEHHERTTILKNIAERLSEQADEFAMLIASEGGKPLLDAKVEVARAIDGIGLAIKELSHVMCGQEIPMGHTAASTGRMAFTTYEPIGVVVAVSAFNHPLNLIIHQVIPAIAVGCPVLVKPASTTPLCCLRFCELVLQAGLPQGWCQPVICNNQVAEKLVTSPRIAFFSFIGSAKIGWLLRSKLAPGTRCALEHGGVAPAIIEPDAILDEVIPSVVKGGFYHAGQVCVSVQRLYIHEDILDTVLDQIVPLTESLNVGDPRDIETEVGPLIQTWEVDRVSDWVDEAVAKGATLLCGGKKLTDSTYSPTLLLNPPEDVTISQKEVFGPVVCLYSYRDRLEAIERANSLDVAFQAAIYTQNINIALDTVKRLDSTAVMVNDHTAFRVDWMPFAGRRASGHGIGGIGYTMHDMIQAKMAVIKL